MKQTDQTLPTSYSECVDKSGIEEEAGARIAYAL